jgi:hypothetical protein
LTDSQRPLGMKIFLKLLLWSAIFQAVLFFFINVHVPVLSDITFVILWPIINAAWFWPEIGDSPTGIFVVPWLFWFTILTSVFVLICVLNRFNFQPRGLAGIYKWFGAESITNRDIDNFKTKKRISLYDAAAWVSLFIPCAEVTTLFGFSLIPNDAHTSDNTITTVLGYAFFSLIGSFIAGVISLFGIHSHRYKLTLWLGLIGILASAAMGFLTFLGLALSSMGHNC